MAKRPESDGGAVESRCCNHVVVFEKAVNDRFLG